ncbi:DUF4832 domain-containing protein [Lentzea sp. NPDC059081]|uniref:DUF4832 domain-containing protein n=1 Tax=Lentzea sp. NPDC059081 TaxID=3346719 RepID=UPI0036BA855A
MSTATPKRRRVVAALCAAAVALLPVALPGPTRAADLSAQGVPDRPSPGPSPDPSLPSHTLATADAPLDNPLKGFARFLQPGTDPNAGYPLSLTWAYFGLSEVMTDATNCASYNWGVVDSALNTIAAAGNHAAIRLYMEYPGGGTGSHPGNAIPQCFNGHVAMRHNAYWDVTSPDYDNPYLVTGLKNFITAFAARYDGDPRLGYIHLGLIGLWGEWHTWPYDTDTSGDTYPNYMPTNANAADIINTYNRAFTRTRLELRYADNAGGAADSLPAIGYHDDSFCFREGGQGVTLPMSMGGASWSQLQKALEHGVENRWTTASMGGEVRPEIQSVAFANWPNGSGAVDNIKACVELEHTTWKINELSRDYSPTDPNVAAAVRLMGYNLTVRNAYFHGTAQGSTKVGVRIDNTGVAPFYYPWTVSLGLKDAAGTVVRSWTTSWDLRQIQPTRIRAFPDWQVGADPTYRDFGYARYFDTSVDLSGVGTGSYRLVMKVKNPLETINANAKKLRFANAGQNADGWLDLGGMAVGAGTTSGYEAESTGNTLSGGAVVSACGGCSGGSKVGYLGNGGTLTFNDVDGGAGGTRTVTLHYASPEARNARIQANGGTAQTVGFPSTPDWSTTRTTTVSLSLRAGRGNTVTLSNPSGWAPDIDKITVS